MVLSHPLWPKDRWLFSIQNLPSQHSPCSALRCWMSSPGVPAEKSVSTGRPPTGKHWDLLSFRLCFLYAKNVPLLLQYSHIFSTSVGILNRSRSAAQISWVPAKSMSSHLRLSQATPTKVTDFGWLRPNAPNMVIIRSEIFSLEDSMCVFNFQDEGTCCTNLKANDVLRKCDTVPYFETNPFGCFPETSR